MKHTSFLKQCLIICGFISSGTQAVHGNDFQINKMHVLGTTALLSGIAYATYLHMNQLHHQQIPDASTTHKKSIIFDIDGVLSTTNKLQAFYEVGIPTTLRYMQDQMQLPSEKILFDTLANVPAISQYTSYNKGIRMPQIMVDWQIGAQDLKTIRNSIIEYLATSNLPESQKNWALQTALMMTNPQQFIATRTTIPANVALLHELKDKGYKLYILSNWDSSSFPLFKIKFPEIFMHNDKPTFDGIMISGDIKTLKPEMSIFRQCLKKFKLKAEHTIFIDDEPANIQTAQKFGITTVLSDPNNTQAVRDDLITAMKHKSQSEIN